MDAAEVRIYPKRVPDLFKERYSQLLSELNEEAFKQLSKQISELDKTLSIKMKEIQLQVDISQSLIKLLSKDFDPAADEANTRPLMIRRASIIQLSVVVDIPDFNTPPRDSDELQQKLSQLFIKSLSALKYQEDDTLSKFSTKIASPLPIIEKLWETLFDEDVSDAQALVALAIVFEKLS